MASVSFAILRTEHNPVDPLQGVADLSLHNPDDYKREQQPAAGHVTPTPLRVQHRTPSAQRTQNRVRGRYTTANALLGCIKQSRQGTRWRESSKRFHLQIIYKKGRPQKKTSILIFSHSVPQRAISHKKGQHACGHFCVRRTSLPYGLQHKHLLPCPAAVAGHIPRLPNPPWRHTYTRSAGK